MRFGNSSPSIALPEAIRVSADSLRPSTTQSTRSSGVRLNYLPPAEPPNNDFEIIAIRIALIFANSSLE